MGKGWGDGWRSLKESDLAAKLPTRLPSVPKVNKVLAAVSFQCKMLGLPAPVAEFQFHPTRKWQLDIAWPDLKVAIEQEGIVYPKERGEHRLGGRHASVKGFRGDIDKYGEAFRLGWQVLRVLPEHIENGQAMVWAEDTLRVAVSRAKEPRP